MHMHIIGLNRYPISKEEENLWEIFNWIFSLFFLLEMIIKLFGFGIKDYFRDKLNTFDCLIVIFSIAEFMID